MSTEVEQKIGGWRWIRRHWQDCQLWRAKPSIPKMAEPPTSCIYKLPLYSTVVLCFGPFSVKPQNREVVGNIVQMPDHQVHPSWPVAAGSRSWYGCLPTVPVTVDHQVWHTIQNAVWQCYQLCSGRMGTERSLQGHGTCAAVPAGEEEDFLLIHFLCAQHFGGAWEWEVQSVTCFHIYGQCHNRWSTSNGRGRTGAMINNRGENLVRYYSMIRLKALAAQTLETCHGLRCVGH